MVTTGRTYYILTPHITVAPSILCVLAYVTIYIIALWYILCILYEILIVYVTLAI